MTETADFPSNFPTVIDNTIRESFRNCPQKMFRGHVQSLAPLTPSVHLHAGAAFAAALEAARKAYYTRGDSEDAALALGLQTLIEHYGDFEPPTHGSGANKTPEKLMEALGSYFEEYPLATDHIKPLMSINGEAAVEFTFAIPLPSNHPVSGEPLLYGGRFDMLGVRNDVLFAVDEKTTSQLGATWSAQWDLNSQFTGYTWAAQQFGYPVAGAIIRGIGLLKSSVTHAEAIIYRPAWQIERWYAQLLHDIELMVKAWNSGYWDYALGSACSAYGGCPFKTLCMSPTPEAWISSNFTRRVWNPLWKGED